MSMSATTPSDWDDQLSEVFSDAFSDAFQVPLRKVTKNVLDRLSGDSSSPLDGFEGDDSGKDGEKGSDDHLQMENALCNLQQQSTTESAAITEQVDSLTLSYSSSSDTNGREARDDFAEEGTVSSEDASIAARPADASTKTAKVNDVQKAAEGADASATKGGIANLTARKRLHQKYKLRLTEVHSKKKEEEEEEEPENTSAPTSEVKISRKDNASERLAKSRERFINRRRGEIGVVGQEGVTSLTPPPPPPPPPPQPLPTHQAHAVTTTALSEDDNALAIEKIESIVKQYTSNNARSPTDFALLTHELARLKEQIASEVEESNDKIMVLEANLDAAKIEHDSQLQQLQELNEELTFSKAEKQCLANKMEDLIDKLTSVKAEKATLQYTADSVNTANRKLAQAAAELKRRTKILDEKVDLLEGEKSNMETELKQKDVVLLQLEETLKVLNNEVQTKNLEAEKLVQERSTLRDQVLSLQGTVSTLQETVAAKQKTVEEAEEHAVSLEVQISLSKNELAKLTKESEELHKFKADAETRIDLLRHAMTEYSHQVIDLEAKLEESQAARACLEDEVTTLKDSNAGLVKKLTKASAENDKKDVTIHEVKKQADAAVKAAVDQCDHLESQVTMLKRQLHESMIRSAKIEEENREMKYRLNAAEENAERLTQENTESDELVVDLEARVLDMIVENRKVATSLEELQSTVDTVTKERDFAQSTVMELMSRNEKAATTIQTLQLEKDELLTKLVKTEETLKVCETEKCNYLTASTLANKERQTEATRFSEDVAAMAAHALELEAKVESLNANLTMSKSELEETKSKLESAQSVSKMLELEYRATMGMLEVTKGDKEKVAADLMDALNGVLASSNDRDRESTAQLTALTTERDELAKKVSSSNAELIEMRALVKTLQEEKNAALAKMNHLVLANSTVLESKVNEVTCRLDSEFAESQQQMDILNAKITELQGENSRLNKENNQLYSGKKILEARAAELEQTKASLEKANTRLKVDKAMAETREASLKETAAALEEIKERKRVTWSQICPTSVSNEIVSPRPTSPVSSCISGSDYVDPSIAEQVNKALDWARSRRNLP